MESNIKERPILFSAPMVRAILDGRKLQTRRIIKPQPPTGVTFAGQYRASGQPYDGEFEWCTGDPKDVDTWMMSDTEACRCPYGGVGERLWVRETWAMNIPPSGAVYRADGWGYGDPIQWKPSIFMPRWASRITLGIEDVRVERVQDISEEDAKAEGVHKEGNVHVFGLTPTFRGGYANIWDELNKRRGFGWEVNPWVWVIEFKVLNDAAAARLPVDSGHTERGKGPDAL